MAIATAKQRERSFEIRVRFEPGLGAALYASLKSGEVAPVTVTRTLGRGRTLLRYHGYTLMAHGAPEWKPGDTFPVYVKQLGPPLVLARVGDSKSGASGSPGASRDRDPARSVTLIDSAVVPGFEERPS